jgi:hypothetical protein
LGGLVAKETGLISRKTGLVVLVVITVIVVVVGFLLQPIPQPQSYHQFADQRALWGIPNVGDVVSNVGFAIAGVLGLVFLLRLNDAKDSQYFVGRYFEDRRERWFYLIYLPVCCLLRLGLRTIICILIMHGWCGTGCR